MLDLQGHEWQTVKPCVIPHFATVPSVSIPVIIISTDIIINTLSIDQSKVLKFTQYIVSNFLRSPILLFVYVCICSIWIVINFV